VGQLYLRRHGVEINNKNTVRNFPKSVLKRKIYAELPTLQVPFYYRSDPKSGMRNNMQYFANGARLKRRMG
jgi:hypothetical protein